MLGSRVGSFTESDISLTALLWATSHYEWGRNAEKHPAPRKAHLDVSDGTHPHGQDAGWGFPRRVPGFQAPCGAKVGDQEKGSAPEGGDTLHTEGVVGSGEERRNEGEQRRNSGRGGCVRRRARVRGTRRPGVRKSQQECGARVGDQGKLCRARGRRRGAGATPRVRLRQPRPGRWLGAAGGSEGRAPTRARAAGARGRRVHAGGSAGVYTRTHEGGDTGRACARRELGRRAPRHTQPWPPPPPLIHPHPHPRTRQAVTFLLSPHLFLLVAGVHVAVGVAGFELQVPQAHGQTGWCGVGGLGGGTREGKSEKGSGSHAARKLSSRRPPPSARARLRLPPASAPRTPPQQHLTACQLGHASREPNTRAGPASQPLAIAASHWLYRPPLSAFRPPRAPTSAPGRTRRRRLEPDAKDVGEREGAEPGREGAGNGLATRVGRGANAWEEQKEADTTPQASWGKEEGVASRPGASGDLGIPALGTGKCGSGRCEFTRCPCSLQLAHLHGICQIIWSCLLSGQILYNRKKWTDWEMVPDHRQRAPQPCSKNYKFHWSSVKFGKHQGKLD